MFIKIYKCKPKSCLLCTKSECCFNAAGVRCFFFPHERVYLSCVTADKLTTNFTLSLISKHQRGVHSLPLLTVSSCLCGGLLSLERFFKKATDSLLSQSLLHISFISSDPCRGMSDQSVLCLVCLPPLLVFQGSVQMDRSCRAPY